MTSASAPRKVFTGSWFPVVVRLTPAEDRFSGIANRQFVMQPVNALVNARIIVWPPTLDILGFHSLRAVSALTPSWVVLSTRSSSMRFKFLDIRVVQSL
ncbi:hypothetical protein BR93DRAFT_928993, partial [Coniochaeta sp. PMI_546]